MASSVFPSTVTGVTVQTATSGALTGDGSSGNKLGVLVDGVTIDVNGSNQLEAIGGGGGSPPFTVANGDPVILNATSDVLVLVDAGGNPELRTYRAGHVLDGGLVVDAPSSYVLYTAPDAGTAGAVGWTTTDGAGVSAGAAVTVNDIDVGIAAWNLSLDDGDGGTNLLALSVSAPDGPALITTGQFPMHLGTLAHPWATVQSLVYQAADGSAGVSGTITTADLVGKSAVFKDGLLVSYGP